LGTKIENFRLFLILAALLTVQTLIGCTGKETLTPVDLMLRTPDETATVNVNFCTKKSEFVPIKKKYIFILDKSTSNARNYKMNPDGSPMLVGGNLVVPACPSADPANPCLGTDPLGTRRYPELVRFLQTEPEDEALQYYALINFSNNASRVGGGGFRGGSEASRLNFLSSVQDEYCPYQLAQQTQLGIPAPPECAGASTATGDEGSTNYLNALNSALNLIEQDANQAQSNWSSDPVASTYIIVFISDGFPILSLDITTDPITIDSQGRGPILEVVREIKSQAITRPNVIDDIILFTGYYFVNENQDPMARALLHDMAVEGGGIDFVFGSGQPIDFSYFSVPPRQIKYAMSNVIVTNSTTTWDEDGPLARDSDEDGVSDTRELAEGTSINNRDSDGDGIGDYLESRNDAISFACGAYGTGDPDLDGLNNCEEAYLANIGGRNDPDTNKNFLPDGLEYRHRLDFISAPTNAGNDPDFDGMPNFQEIQQGLPAFVNNQQLMHPKPYNYRLSVTSSDDIEDCYNLVVSNITLMGENNLIQVHFFEYSSVILNVNIMHRAQKRFVGASRELTINTQELEPAAWRSVTWRP
jgi:hypothetical protein